MNTQRTHAIPSDATAHAQILAGRYQIEGVLGRGSMATVYRAVDLHTRTACAVKTLNGNYALSEDAKRRFIREAEIISRIEHPHIVKQIDLCFSDEGAPILAMELLEGEDLASLLSRRTVLPVQEALPIAFQVADALAALHQHGVLHRDIKPHNVFLCAGLGEKPHVKLVDLGLAKLLWPAEGGVQSEQMLIGTPEYLAPEATTGRPGDVDARIDQWALAVLLYRMLSGRLPFSSSGSVHDLLHRIRTLPPIPLGSLAPQVPALYVQAIRRAMQKNRDNRFGSVQAFAQALIGQDQATQTEEDQTVITMRPAAREPLPMAQPVSVSAAPPQIREAIPTKNRAPVIPPKGFLNRRRIAATLVTAPALLLGIAFLQTIQQSPHAQPAQPAKTAPAVTEPISIRSYIPDHVAQTPDPRAALEIVSLSKPPPQIKHSSKQKPTDSRRVKRKRIRSPGRVHR